MNCDNVTKLENVKIGQIPKKRSYLAISKPENHNVMRKTAINIEFDFNKKNKFSFFAENKLQVDQIKRKVEAKSNKSFFN